MDAAVLVIDMQNGFCSSGGSVVDVMGVHCDTMQSVIAEIRQLLAAARRAEVPIYFTRHMSRPKLRDATPRARAAAPDIATTPLLRGSWDAEIIDALYVDTSDVVIDKIRYDAFLYTDLDPILRSDGIRRLLVVGTVTNLCVESSVRSAEQRGYDVYVASDACAGPESTHEAALTAMDGWFATVAGWRAVLAGLIETDTPC